MSRLLFVLSLLVVLPIQLVWAQQIRDQLPPDECQPDDERIEVLLLGSYHMSNPGMDQFNLDADDVKTEKRQQEIKHLVEQLTTFQPTKVAIESPYGDTSAVAAYRQYVAGDHELRRSEEEQIGFRLAKMLGHSGIYPIDVRMPLDNSALGPLVAGNPDHQRRMAELEQFGQAALEYMATLLAHGTVSEMLYQMNRPDMLAQAHMPYVDYLTPIADGDSYAGADMVATWFKRNLRIFANMVRISEPHDRIFVVYGQGHIPILRQLVMDASDYCLVDPLPYLN